MTRPSKSAHVPHRLWGLDLLRVGAVLSVVLYHYPKAPEQLWLRAVSHYGWVGVDLFFVLSGYLIAGQFFTRAQRGLPLSLGQFYMRRFFRTLPNYFFMLALYIGIEGRTFSEWPKYLFFLQNFSLPLVFSHSWSLCVEEHFYLGFPWIARSLTRVNVALMAVAILLASASLRYLIWRHARPDLIYAVNVDDAFTVYLSKLYYPTYVRLDGLTIGITLAAIRVLRPERWSKWTAYPLVSLGMGLGFLVAAVGVLYRQMSGVGIVLGFPLLALGFGALLVCSVSEGSLLTRLRIPGISELAVLSYAMYLTHPLALGLADRLTKNLGASSTGIVMLLVSLVILPLCAYLLYALIERPGMRLRDKLYPAAG